MEKPDTTPASTEVKFENIEGYNLQVGNANQSRSQRIMIFRGLPPFDNFIHVTATNVLLSGQGVQQEMRRLFSNHGRPTLIEMIPGGISGKTHTKLRAFLGLSK